VLLNAAGRQLLAGLCGVEEDVLARALPSWGQEDTKLPAEEDGVPAAASRIGGAAGLVPRREPQGLHSSSAVTIDNDSR
jgi:hypothetical protein